MYAGRLSHYCKFSAVYVNDLKNAGSLSAEQIKAKEGELILKELQKDKNSCVILLDEKGQRYTSLKWAESLQKKLNFDKDLTFIIGGAYGFSPSVYEAANEKLSFSDMTFSHQIIRLLFMEQLYRAFTIMRGEPYHK